MLQHMAIGLCLALTPGALRDIRREQWAADLRDAQSIGMSSKAVLIGIATAAIHLRVSHTIMSTQGVSSLSKGKNMKVTLLTICSALALAVVGAVGVQTILPSKEVVPVVNIDGLLESVDHPDDVVIGIDPAGSGTPAN